MTDRSDRGEIHLGDLARALASLHWENDEQARAIAACLGFGLQAAPKPGPPTEIYDRQRYRRQATAAVQTAARVSRICAAGPRAATDPAGECSLELPAAHRRACARRAGGIGMVGRSGRAVQRRGRKRGFAAAPVSRSGPTATSSPLRSPPCASGKRSKSPA